MQILWHDVHHKLQLLLIGQAFDHSQSFFQDVMHQQTFQIDLCFAGINLGDIQNIVDQLQQMGTAQPDVLHIFFLLFI